MPIRRGQVYETPGQVRHVTLYEATQLDGLLYFLENGDPNRAEAKLLKCLNEEYEIYQIIETRGVILWRKTCTIEVGVEKGPTSTFGPT